MPHPGLWASTGPCRRLFSSVCSSKLGHVACPTILTRILLLWQVRGTNPKNFYDVFQDMILFNGAFSWDLTCAVRRSD